MAIEPVMLCNHLNPSHDYSFYLDSNSQGHFTEIKGMEVLGGREYCHFLFPGNSHSKDEGPFKIRTFTYKLHLENG